MLRGSWKSNAAIKIRRKVAGGETEGTKKKLRSEDYSFFVLKTVLSIWREVQGAALSAGLR